MSFFYQAFQTYIASLETIYLRSLYLTPVWGSMSPWQFAESRRMVSEKGAAWKESQFQIALAPWSFVMHINVELWRAAFASGRGVTALPLHMPRILSKASEAAMVNALGPYRRRTTGNSKRLKRRAVGL